MIRTPNRAETPARRQPGLPPNWHEKATVGQVERLLAEIREHRRQAAILDSRLKDFLGKVGFTRRPKKYKKSLKQAAIELARQHAKAEREARKILESEGLLVSLPQKTVAEKVQEVRDAFDNPPETVAWPESIG